MARPAPIIQNEEAAFALFAALGEESVEVAEAAYLDPEWRLLERRRFIGTIGDVAVSIRALVAGGIALNAARLLIAHNHPSGDPRPSARDVAFTRRLADTLAAIDMPLVDHLIVTPAAVMSFRRSRLL